MKHCLLFAITLLAVGCQHVVPGKLSSVKTSSQHPRAGNVYLIRGWIGVFSAGIDDFQVDLEQHGVRAVVYQDMQWPWLAGQIAKEYRGKEGQAEPLVLVGHSYGADDVVQVARRLDQDNITVDLLITFDPVTPARVPGNVKRSVNLYQSNTAMDWIPFLRGVPLVSEDNIPGQIINEDVRKERRDLLEHNTNHFTIEKKKKVQGEALRYVLETCPPHDQWTAARTAAPIAPYSQAIPAANVTAAPIRSSAAGSDAPRGN